MLLERLEDLGRGVGHAPPHLRVEDLLLDRGVCRQRLDHLVDDLPAALGRAFTELLERLEQLLHLVVVLLQQREGVGRPRA
jgi:hypothetical protein